MWALQRRIPLGGMPSLPVKLDEGCGVLAFGMPGPAVLF